MATDWASFLQQITSEASARGQYEYERLWRDFVPVARLSKGHSQKLEALIKNLNDAPAQHRGFVAVTIAVVLEPIE